MKRSLFACAGLLLLPAMLARWRHRPPQTPPMRAPGESPVAGRSSTPAKDRPRRSGLFRTADGLLHVVHKQVMSPSQLGYVHSAINPAGTTVAQSNVELGPVTTVSDFPKLTGTPTGGCGS